MLRKVPFTDKRLRQIGMHIMLSLSLAVLLPAILPHAPSALAAGCASNEQWCECASSCIGMNTICLLEPVAGTCVIDSGASPFDQYLNNAWGWAFGIGVSIAVLQVVVSGFRMVVQGPSGVEASKQRIMWAIAGLLLLLLAGSILSFINPVGFSQS